MNKMRVKSKPLPGLLWPTIAVLIIIVAYALSNSHYNVMMNSVIDAFDLVGASQGLLSSMLSVGGIVALLLSPVLQGRINKWLMLVLSMLIQVFMLFIAGIVPNFAVMVIIYILLGIGGGWTDTYGNSLMVDLHMKESAKYLGLLHGCYSIGAVLTPLLIQWLLIHFKWQRTYISSSIIVLIFVMISIGALFASKSYKTKQITTTEKKVTLEFIKIYLKKKRNLLLILSSILIAASQSGLLGWVVRYMTLEFGSETFGSLTISVFWICATISRIIAPRFRFNQLKVYGYGALLSGIFIFIGVISGSSIWMNILMGAAGLVSGHCIPVLISEGTIDYEDSTSLPTSVLLLSMSLARVIMPLIMGAMAGETSIFWAMLLPAAAAVLAFLSSCWISKE
jgi:fucose permease